MFSDLGLSLFYYEKSLKLRREVILFSWSDKLRSGFSKKSTEALLLGNILEKNDKF